MMLAHLNFADREQQRRESKSNHKKLINDESFCDNRSNIIFIQDLYTAKEQGKDKFGHGSCDHKAILHAVPAQDVSLVHAQQE